MRALMEARYEAVSAELSDLTQIHKPLAVQTRGVPMDKRCMLGRPTVCLSSSGDRGHHQIYKLLASNRDSASFT